MSIALSINAPTTSKSSESNCLCDIYYSPSYIRPFPKAEPRKAIVKDRKRRKAAIVTGTPNKNKLEAVKKCKKK